MGLILGLLKLCDSNFYNFVGYNAENKQDLRDSPVVQGLIMRKSKRIWSRKNVYLLNWVLGNFPDLTRQAKKHEWIVIVCFARRAQDHNEKVEERRKSDRRCLQTVLHTLLASRTLYSTSQVGPTPCFLRARRREQCELITELCCEKLDSLAEMYQADERRNVSLSRRSHVWFVLSKSFIPVVLRCFPDSSLLIPQHSTADGLAIAALDLTPR